MTRIEQMVTWLKNEVNIWIAKGIITPVQKDQILALYKVSPEQAGPAAIKTAARGHGSTINIARVILVLGVICIAVGLVIFYASNWRKMPPGF